MNFTSMLEEEAKLLIGLSCKLCLSDPYKINEHKKRELNDQNIVTNGNNSDLGDFIDSEHGDYNNNTNNSDNDNTEKERLYINNKIQNNRNNLDDFDTTREYINSLGSIRPVSLKQSLMKRIVDQTEKLKNKNPKLLPTKVNNYDVYSGIFSLDQNKCSKCDGYHTVGNINANKTPNTNNTNNNSSSGDNSDKRHIHPEDRIGPVFTTLFNSSINQKEIKTEANIDELKNFIPEKTEADILMARYRTSVHPLVPVIDWQIFYPNYKNFWNTDKEADINFLIILFTVFYATSVSLFEERSIDKQEDKHVLIRQMKCYVACTEIALAMAEYPEKVTVVGLQSSVILYTLVRNDCRTDDYISISSLVRCAQSIELNRDPLNYHHLDNLKEIQFKRILWWQILYLDCMTALSTRLSPLISEYEFDTQFPK